MKTNHITKLLDGAAFTALNEADLAIISTHAKDCADCRKAFEAAHISSALLKTQAASEMHLPSPFFQAKVLNALRERQNLQKPIEAFRRWWQASAAMVGLMVMIVVCLVAVSFVAPSSDDGEAQAGISNFNLYSTDAVLLNQNPPPDLTNEQVFQVLYNTKSDFGKQK